VSWPQWTWIALVGLGWLHTLLHHGEPKTGLGAREDIGIATASLGLNAFLLWQGGFFG
jgi:hypothetical protein